MKLKSATLKNFKRFTHLTVRGVSETVRLIMFAGPNGCGKSSFFDALYTWHGWSSQKNPSWDSDYHAKMGSSFRSRWTSQDVSVEFHVPPLSGEEKKGCNSHTDTDHCQLRIGTTLSRVVTSAL